ncbi:MAG TPA: hypothetical protein VEO20_00885 [Thermoplasmata archaeon]|nr:hypothetical protein [Thermoplasmata archaeon]
MDESRWVEVPVQTWTNATGTIKDRFYLAFEPVLPQSGDDQALNKVRAWVRLVAVDVSKVGEPDRRFYHVNVGSDWRRLLGAQLQQFDENSGIWYVQGRAEKLENPPKDPPSLPSDLHLKLRAQWKKDYGEELKE